MNNHDQERERDQQELETAHRQAERDEAMMAAIRRGRAEAQALVRRGGGVREAGSALTKIYDILQRLAELQPQ